MDFLFLRLESSNCCQDQSTGPSVRGFLMNVSTILYPYVHNNVMIVVIFFSTDKLPTHPLQQKNCEKKIKNSSCPLLLPSVLRVFIFLFFIFLFCLFLFWHRKWSVVRFDFYQVWFVYNYRMSWINSAKNGLCPTAS